MGSETDLEGEVDATVDLAFDYLTSLASSQQTIPPRMDLMRYLIKQLEVSNTVVVKAVNKMELKYASELRGMGYKFARSSR